MRQLTIPRTVATMPRLHDTQHDAAAMRDGAAARADAIAAQDDAAAAQQNVVAAQENVVAALRAERLRCARDVHDIVLQDLTAVLLQLRAASGNADPAQVAACLATAMLAAEQGLASARDFVRRLRDAVPAHPMPSRAVPAHAVSARESAASPAAAIRAALASQPLAAGSRLRLQLDDAAALPPAACEQVAMIVREAVGNAAKHAQARVIACRLRVRAGRVQVQVRDDGAGFDPHQSRAGFGIGGMHERAVLAGAALRVDSAPGRGTTVFLSLPLAGE